MSHSSFGSLAAGYLADRYGRRTLLAINIALFSLLMPVVAYSPTFAVFVIARSMVGFALSGEWSLGSMLVAETWPAHLRGRVISITRSTWCLGASLAGGITGLVDSGGGFGSLLLGGRGFVLAASQGQDGSGEQDVEFVVHGGCPW